MRAALALGAFNTPLARKALLAGRRDPNLAPFCNAALYRQQNDAKLLAELEKSVADDDGHTMFVLARYFSNKTDSEPAANLAHKWVERLKKLRADEDLDAVR